MHWKLTRPAVASVAVLAIGLAACGSDDGATSADASSAAGGGVPTIVVTTNILGDVVGEIVGDEAEVVTIMPVGADPHDFQASAQEVDAMVSADALIVNGAGFEEGLLDVIENAEGEGVPTFESIDAVDTLEFGEDSHDDEDHDDQEHSDDHGDDHSDGEDHDDHGDDDHDHSGVDPHFFTDPMEMAEAVDGIVAFLQDEIEFSDSAAIDESAQAYRDELTALDAEVSETLSPIPVERRVLVTNHEVFGYFADRYDFEIVGTVIPGGTTTDGVSAGEIADLAEVVDAEGVPAIFGDSSSDGLVDTLATEVGSDVAVVDLYTESLGDSDSDGATYLEMVRANAERISSALA